MLAGDNDNIRTTFRRHFEPRSCRLLIKSLLENSMRDCVM